jgi:hypothetical protein
VKDFSRAQLYQPAQARIKKPQIHSCHSGLRNVKYTTFTVSAFLKEAAMPERLLRRVKELLDASKDLIAESQRIRQKAENLARESRSLRSAESGPLDDLGNEPSPRHESTN